MPQKMYLCTFFFLLRRTLFVLSEIFVPFETFFQFVFWTRRKTTTKLLLGPLSISRVQQMWVYSTVKSFQKITSMTLYYGFEWLIGYRKLTSPRNEVAKLVYLSHRSWHKLRTDSKKRKLFGVKYGSVHVILNHQ